MRNLSQAIYSVWDTVLSQKESGSTFQVVVLLLHDYMWEVWMRTFLNCRLPKMKAISVSFRSNPTFIISHHMLHNSERHLSNPQKREIAFCTWGPSVGEGLINFWIFRWYFNFYFILKSTMMH